MGELARTAVQTLDGLDDMSKEDGSPDCECRRGLREHASAKQSTFLCINFFIYRTPQP